MQNEICVAVVIKNRNNEILLAKEERDKIYEKSGGLWTLPAGRVEVGEDFVSAAKREVREEIGIDINITGAIGVYQLSTKIPENCVLGVALIAEIETNKKHNAELKNVAWIDIDSSVGKIVFRKGMKEIIEGYRSNKSFPIEHLRFINID